MALDTAALIKDGFDERRLGSLMWRASRLPLRAELASRVREGHARWEADDVMLFETRRSPFVRDGGRSCGRGAQLGAYPRPTFLNADKSDVLDNQGGHLRPPKLDEAPNGGVAPSNVSLTQARSDG